MQFAIIALVASNVGRAATITFDWTVGPTDPVEVTTAQSATLTFNIPAFSSVDAYQFSAIFSGDLFTSGDEYSITIDGHTPFYETGAIGGGPQGPTSSTTGELFAVDPFSPFFPYLEGGGHLTFDLRWTAAGFGPCIGTTDGDRNADARA